MRRHIVTILLLVMVALAPDGAALAQKSWENLWEKPKDGWWKDLRAGETATFEMSVGDMRTQVVTTVQKVDGSKITFTTRTLYEGMTMPVVSETIDVSEHAFGGAGHPPEMVVNKGKKSDFRAGDARFEVTEYMVQSGDVKIQAWHSPDLPPIFNGGNVKFRLSGEQPMEMTLVSYRKGG